MYQIVVFVETEFVSINIWIQNIRINITESFKKAPIFFPLLNSTGTLFYADWTKNLQQIGIFCGNVE